jgi:sulfotransferase
MPTASAYHFISGLPRSGFTLLSAILRQNPRFYADISLPVNPFVSGELNTVTAGGEFGLAKFSAACH